MRFVGGTDGRVFMVAGGNVAPLGSYEWGIKIPTARMRDLAKRMLIEAVGMDKANRYYTRLAHRLVTSWPTGQAWTITIEELNGHIKAMDEAQAEYAKFRAQAEREVPRVQPAGAQFPGATGYGGNDTAPDRRR